MFMDAHPVSTRQHQSRRAGMSVGANDAQHHGHRVIRSAERQGSETALERFCEADIYGEVVGTHPSSAVTPVSVTAIC